MPGRHPSARIVPARVRGMKTTDNGRDARSQAARRLRNLTIGTAVLGVVATAGLSAIASATNDGAPATTSTATTSTTTTSSGTTSTRTTSTGTTSATPAVTAATGTGHASTGGS